MSTRPGSSIAPLAPSVNSKKRSTSEACADIENSRSLKKSKRDDENKDKKKRPRKRRRKSSVVTVVEPDIRARSKSRSMTVPTHDTAQEEVDVTPENVLDEEAQPSQDVNHAEDIEDTSPRIPYADKGKGKAKQESLPPTVESPESQIARLYQELEAQRVLLREHQSHLTHVHQALTCQICLDLLYKPFALAPCGHIICYPCLVRWFTAPEAPGELHSLQEEIPGPPETSHCHKKKKCPVCRTYIIERPVEVWGVKSMVTGLVRSGLVELPAPPPALEPEASTSTNDDPWRNIFRRPNRFFIDVLEPRPPRPPRPGGEGLEEMGMYDADDGGIYRCIDCMHEIWRGVCTHCHREYPGHQASEDDEDDEDLEFDAGGEFRDILHLFANAPNAYFDDYGANMNSDSEASAGFIFGEEIDDEEDEEDDVYDLVQIPRARNSAHPGAPRTLGPIYRHPFDDFFPIGHPQEERGNVHIDEVQVEESGDESDEYEGSFIDDFEAPPSAPSPERLPRSSRSRRGQRHVSDVIDDEDSDVEVIVTEGAARQLGRITRSWRASSRDIVQDPIMVSDDDDELSDLLPGRTTARRARNIIEVSEDSENESSLGEDDADDDDDKRTYEDDGSRLGPSSRLLRLMNQPAIDEGEDEDEDEEWFPIEQAEKEHANSTIKIRKCAPLTRAEE
ncbi:hypothetical protein C0995_001211 [Termitomyces sp. Mi166|nr:hypothetical protein C0995_001211 [Termitomyces sp. Mi166\